MILIGFFAYYTNGTLQLLSVFTILIYGLLVNGKSTALIEVKYKAKPENIKIDKLIERARFLKEKTTEHKNHNIYLGVAALAFNKKLAKELRAAGIATIHQVGKKMVVYDKEVKAF
jgi:hypothetical protein